LIKFVQKNRTNISLKITNLHRACKAAVTH
jgi:hypothetical protein